MSSFMTHEGFSLFPPFKYPAVSIQTSKSTRNKITTPTLNADPAELHTPSTPNPHGKSCHSIENAHQNIKMHTVMPLIADDIDKNQKASVQNMLNFFLNQCAKNDDGPYQEPFNWLPIIIDNLVPICNQQKTKANAKDYCEEVKVEQDRYAPFVTLCNGILESIAGLKIPGLREPTLEVLFHKSDPCDIRTDHNCIGASRDTDARTHFQLVEGRSSENCREFFPYAATTAPERPKYGFSWGDLLSVVEFEIRQKSCRNPPEKYGAILTQQIRHIDNILGPLRAISDHEFTQPPVDEKARNLEAQNPPTKELPFIDAQRQRVMEAVQGHQNPQSIAAGVSRKRNRLESKEHPPKRKKPEPPHPKPEKVDDDTTEENIPPAVQNAAYALELLCRGPFTSHTITILILDDVAWIWWFDRQGAIQSSGINFIQDLPYFAALLFAFQRFNLQNWGLIPELLPHSNYGYPEFNVYFPEEQLVVGAKPTADLYNNYNLTGRCTRVYGACGALGDNLEPLSTNILIGKDLHSQELALKVYWPEETRPNEADILRRAQLLGTSNCAIRDHIPELIASRDIDYSTGKIREWMGHECAKEMHSKSRLLRILLLRYLAPLHPDNLPLDTFMRGWKECFICHFHLWAEGIEHGDISLGNLMWDYEKEKGVLADFDLASFRGTPDKWGGKCTGTVPYMAIDLLGEEFSNGKKKRLYRHDVESFFWVLVWVCTRHALGKSYFNLLWNTSNFSSNQTGKIAFIARGYTDVLTENDDLWCLVTALIGWVRLVNDIPVGGSRRNELPVGEVFQEVLKIIDDNWAWE